MDNEQLITFLDNIMVGDTEFLLNNKPLKRIIINLDEDRDVISVNLES